MGRGFIAIANGWKWHCMEWTLFWFCFFFKVQDKRLIVIRRRLQISTACGNFEQSESDRPTHKAK